MVRRLCAAPRPHSLRMSQTLLAVLALAASLLLVLTVTRARMSGSQQTQIQEAVVLATDAGLEVLDHIRSRPFDAATAAAPVTDRSALTPEPFGTGGTFSAAQDVDDFNGMQPHLVDVGGLVLSTTAAVRYVDEGDLTTIAASPTFAKEVTVLVWGPALPDTLALTQVVTYP